MKFSFARLSRRWRILASMPPGESSLQRRFCPGDPTAVAVSGYSCIQRFQSSSRYARNFRVVSVALELVCANASRGITSSALPAENASITSVRITVALPPLQPISFRVPARASQLAAQSLRSPLPCCPPAPHRRRAQAEKLYVHDRACLALSLRRKLPRA